MSMRSVSLREHKFSIRYIRSLSIFEGLLCVRERTQSLNGERPPVPRAQCGVPVIDHLVGHHPLPAVTVGSGHN